MIMTKESLHFQAVRRMLMLKNFRFIRIHLAAAAVLMGGILVLSPMAAAEPSSSIYDASGRYLGRIDADGRAYDRSGRYLGKTDADGRVYDAAGRYQGRTDKNGRRYDASGRYLGREDLR